MIQNLHTSYRVIGLMSGSSLDGLDIAYCHFERVKESWQFSIIHAECVPYTAEWVEKLRSAREADGRSLWRLHSAYGRLLAAYVNEFIEKHNLSGKVDLISSHGHTIFHFPEESFTTQIGDGATIATGTGITVACDFRTADIALGGQGTPIVPIGDRLLFHDQRYLLNIGGIANITIEAAGKILAFDICAANQVLNHYALTKGMEYDEDGRLAAAGKLHEPLLTALDQLPYYGQAYPKSLDNGFSKEVIALIDSYPLSTEDKLNSYCEHIAAQVCGHIDQTNAIEKMQPTDKDTLFITGGGAFNTHLINRIAAYSKIPIQIPSVEIVKYKEALVIALCGVLCMRGEVNVLSTVTGASRDSVGGAMYKGNGYLH